MHFAFALPDGMDPVNGVNKWSIGLSNRLAAVGRKVFLIDHPKPGTNCRAPLHASVRHLICAGKDPDDFLRKKDVSTYVPTYQSALPAIFVPNYSYGTHAACARIAAKQSHAIRVIGYVHVDLEFMYDLLCHYEPVIHKFVAVSKEIATKLSRRLPSRRNDVLVRPCGVDVAETLDRGYTPDRRPIRLLYAGRIIEHQKRVSDLVRLAERLTENGISYELKIVGSGPDEKILLAKVSSLREKVRQSIYFCGQKPFQEMDGEWSEADIFISTSEFEGTSVSMLEAMAHGCVPVVTNVSGVKAVIRSSENGFVANVGDVESMAEIVAMLSGKRGELNRLGANAHRAIKDRFSMDSYSDWFLSLSDRVWNHSPRAWPTMRNVLKPLSRRQRIRQMLPEHLFEFGRKGKSLIRQMLLDRKPI